MSSLFLVSTVTVDAHLSGTFDRNLRVRCISDLIELLYRDRLSGAHSYEKDVSLVVFEPQTERVTRSRTKGVRDLNLLSFQDLQELLLLQFPCFNIRVVRPHDLKSVIGEIKASSDLYHDRLARTCAWMYSDDNHNESDKPNGKQLGAKCCSQNVYSMLRQLQQARKSREQHKDKIRFSQLISESLDVRQLLTLPKGADDAHYWKLLQTWDFCALSLSICELVWCSFLVLKRASQEADMLLSENDLLMMLITLEASYHQENKFHNFRHAVDVMQATWRLCFHLSRYLDSKSNILLLCVAAIGHDVGHPGTSNVLLSEYKSPVALKYDNKSVLENFHSEVFIGLLSTHLPLLVERQGNLITETILATDMALHSQYVDKLKSNTYASTLMSLIIKAADISNVTRSLEISRQWAVLITWEFNDCALLEKRLKSNDETVEADDCAESIPPSLEETLRKYPSLPKGQLFFINTFAESLFAGLGAKFKEVGFLNENVQSNKRFWEGKCQ
ncbi:LAMI_0F05358g1_1 [Lachancea mirantina]|uniref:Phosphodiesterase n=1 Tax=Lachancea mirantina TaxID=1230905 RepID=A0A1G4JYA3_9SACH|nr:LAMI_0F05358g1_1 [Lachancea mirantina]